MFRAVSVPLDLLLLLPAGGSAPAPSPSPGEPSLQTHLSREDAAKSWQLATLKAEGLPQHLTVLAPRTLPGRRPHGASRSPGGRGRGRRSHLCCRLGRTPPRRPRPGVLFCIETRSSSGPRSVAGLGGAARLHVRVLSWQSLKKHRICKCLAGGRAPRWGGRQNMTRRQNTCTLPLSCSHNSGNSKGLGSSEPGMGMKTKYTLPVMNYIVTDSLQGASIPFTWGFA
ncbi:uncharacterized protein LOC119867271 isoform X1 [Canis lupus familiaris]|uniref:uncharacterized protein LOC119867271 isoform X1 n=1 Tax=Canis lupus familiaris TaxID=9615 RepID=UPI0006B3D22B|nr:uncharacterized protein LOC119867271 isoform X1 [Canis lupus familiaris]